MARNGSRLNEGHEVHHYHLRDDGQFPNSYLPVLLYKNALRLPLFFSADYITGLFASNNWRNAWKAGVYTYHHYHSVTHEVLGFYKGKTSLKLGGENGVEIDVERGDVLLIPAGVAHKNLGGRHAVKCVGAYPDGKEYDILLGKPEERPQAEKNIYAVGLPSRDPLYGEHGKMQEFWKL